MKRIFLDTNILLDDALPRPPFQAEANQVINWCVNHADSTIIAFHTFTNLYYVLRSQRDKSVAVAYLKALAAWTDLAPVSHQQLIDSVDDEDGDVEDKGECYYARDAGADVIVTRDPKGFRNCVIPALGPAEFLNAVP